MAARLVRPDVAATTVRRLILLLIGLTLLAASVQPASAAGRTIVSLTFDDGLTQSPVRDMLRRYGMKGTFYVNANLIGSGGGYLTKAELDALVADGNEVAGHTTNHVDLATLSDAAQRTAICGDLQTLNSWYPGQIHSFAYPFASTGPTTQSIVAEGCPGVGNYSARTVGGLVSGSQCTQCATAETIPPGNPYYINTPESIMSTTTLDDMKRLVTQAEEGGGGWVPLVFHSVCDGCSSYGVSPATLDAFLAWLKQREAGNTHVRTVYQVMSGDLPPAPPPPPLGPNLLLNASLETDQDGNGQADCWQRNNYGVQTLTWTRGNDAQAGAFGERVQITAYSSGDAKLLAQLDAGQAAGGCAPAVEAGASYVLGAWYKATTPVVPVLFYRDSGGVWRYWRDGPLLPAASAWSQFTYNAGTAPAGAQAISFGIAIDSVGTLTTDSYSLRKVLQASGDTTPPTVALSGPAAGATVSGTVTVSATASDDVGVVGVQFKVDGANLGAEAMTAPYSVTWNTTTTGNGTRTLTAVARDAAGQTAVSSARTVTVNNPVPDTTPPTVALSAPAAGATVSGSAVTVSATASDNVGVVGVQFRLDGVNLGAEDTTAPYSITWNTTATTNGTHTLTAVARDAAGNVTTSAVRTVTVSNAVADTTPPTVALSAPAAGATVSGSAVTVSATASDNVGVVGVQFRLDGVNLGAEDTTAPYSITWNTTGTTNGAHTLTAVARDAAGNVTTSAVRTLTVSNAVADTTPPTVALSAPAAGATVSGSAVTVSATASDNVGVVGVQFRLDGVNLGAEDTTAPYSITWNTTGTTNGTHTLTAVARDAAGNVTTSTGRTVTVSNQAAQNLVSNASLETDSNGDGNPDCWLRGGYGSNTVVWSRVTGAHSGTYANSLQITAWTSGDAKLVQTQDTGTCASAAAAGARYTASAWYKSTVPTAFVLFYRSSAGVWTYWTTSPAVASATAWTQASFTTPALPAGATHISFGLALSAVGTLVTDDYALIRVP